MKKIKQLGLFVLLLAMAIPVMAQRRFDPARMAQRQTQQVFDNVKSLTKKQKAQIKQIFTENADTVSKIFNNDSLDRQDKFAQFRKMRGELDTKLKKVFNKEQYKQYEDYITKMRDRFRRRRRN